MNLKILIPLVAVLLCGGYSMPKSAIANSSPVLVQTDWQPLSRPDAGFAIQLPPGEFRESVQPVQTEFQSIDLHLLGIRSPNFLYAVIYSEFPEAAEFDRIPPQDLLDNIMQGVATNVNRRLQDDRSITLDGHPGVDLYYEGANGLTYKHRIYIVDRRWYQVMVVTSEADRSEFATAADRFLNSFNLIP
jgi:hypothetical protein